MLSCQGREFRKENVNKKAYGWFRAPVPTVREETYHGQEGC